MRLGRFLVLGLSAACGVLAGVPAARSLPSGQESLPQGPAFRANVDLVLLPVAVLDTDGRPVTNLGVEEFSVYEDEQPQQITHFLAPDDTPLDLALVLDSSASLAPWARAVRSSAKTFLQALDANDCVVLMPFSEQVSSGYWALAPDPTLSRRIDALFMGGSTLLYDAVHRALVTVGAASTGVPLEQWLGQDDAPGAATVRDASILPEHRHLTRAELSADLERAASATAGWPPTVATRRCGEEVQAEADGSPQRRRAVVLLTDGADKNSQHRFDEVLALAQRTSIPVFPVVMGAARNDLQLRAVLDALAGNTGGSVIEAGSPEELREAYDDVVVLLRASYLLGYLPRDEGSAASRRHEIRVRSRRASYRLVHRAWYLR